MVTSLGYVVQTGCLSPLMQFLSLVFLARLCLIELADRFARFNLIPTLGLVPCHSKLSNSSLCYEWCLK